MCWNEEVEGSHYNALVHKKRRRHQRKLDHTAQCTLALLMTCITVTAETVLQGMLYLQEVYKGIEGALECNAVKDVALCEEGSDCI